MKFSLHHIKDKKNLFRKIYETLPKNGSLIIIDKVPKFQPLGVFFEWLLHIFKIKPVLGNHYHIPLKKIYNIAENEGFIIEDKMIKKPSKLKNFYVYKVFMTLRKPNHA